MGTNTGWPVIHCKITNTSNGIIYIHRPTLHLSKALDGEDKFSFASQKGKYPMKIESGQQISIDYSSGVLHRDFLTKLPQETTLDFIVKTTRSKEYLSNKYTFKEILMHIEISRNVQ